MVKIQLFEWSCSCI